MNVFQQIRDEIERIAGEILPSEKQEEGWFRPVSVELPRDPAHGDLATNAAMVLCKRMGSNPRALAEQFVRSLEALEMVDSVDIAGPGFINLRLSAAFWQEQVIVMLERGQAMVILPQEMRCQ